MSKKHYKAIAAVIRAELLDNPASEPVLRNVASGLASVMAADNPRFSRYTFLDACGLV